eukprot:8997243-Pyramimonas_sp.AAC.1
MSTWPTYSVLPAGASRLPSAAPVLSSTGSAAVDHQAAVRSAAVDHQALAAVLLSDKEQETKLQRLD